MTDPADWFLVVGGLLIAMVFGNSFLEKLPLTPAMLYLGVGVILGPAVLGWLRLDLMRDSALVERVAELAVLVSLFTSGLKLRAPWSDSRWRMPVLLATAGMVVTVALIACVGVAFLHLSLGAAVLLGAILAPTDPVLASAVQVRDPHDRDRLRFSLTGEAGMNDGTAFPFVMLGLGLLGFHELGGGWRWMLVDGLWKSVAGIAVGTLCGRGLTFLILRLRVARREGVGLDNFMALGLIATAYGLAEMVHGWGFLAVFFAGVALRATERRESGDLPTEEVKAAAKATHEDAATDHRSAPAHMAGAVLDFNEQLDRICELSVVILVGALVSAHLHPAALWFAPLLFFGLRPLAVLPCFFRARLRRRDQALVAWFGIRGIGSLYYLAYSLNHGLALPQSETVAAITLSTIAASIVLHGISVDKLMKERAAATV